MANENPRLDHEGVPPEIDPALTSAGVLVLRAALEQGDEERMAEFAQYPDVLRALYKILTHEGQAQKVQQMRNVYRGLFDFDKEIQ
jgi:hypothetical protein